MKLRILTALAVLMAALGAAGAASAAACSDPLSYNEVDPYRSVSGVEIDWYVTVKPGCSGTVRIVPFRDVADDSDDIRSVQFSASPITTYPAGSHVLNTVIAGDEPAWVALYAQGVLYRVFLLDPTTIP